MRALLIAFSALALVACGQTTTQTPATTEAPAASRNGVAEVSIPRFPIVIPIAIHPIVANMRMKGN